MSTDPAVDAAQRARIGAQRDCCQTYAVMSAREALAPIRKLHERGYLNDNPYDAAKWCCGECETPWPCATAELVYSAEELREEQ